jgi:small subunit ribosomal protein S4
MGDPKKQRKKFETPRFRWRTDILQEELKLIGQYGLRNKHELWRHKTMLSKTRGIARSLIGKTPEERVKMENELLMRLKKLGILAETSIPPAYNTWTHKHRKPTRHSAKLHCLNRR